MLTASRLGLLPLFVVAGLAACNCGDPVLPDAGPARDAGPSCTVGQAGCACRADDSCDDGLACVNEACTADTPQGLSFPADAAGCEILLVESSGALRVTFGDGVQGTFVRESPKVAVALTGDAGGLSASVSGGEFTISSSRCVDAAGADVTGTVVAQ